MATKTTTKPKTETSASPKEEAKVCLFKKTYIGTYGNFQKGNKYILAPNLQKIFKDDIEIC